MKNEKSESSVIRTVFRKDGYSGVVTAFFPDEPSIMGRGYIVCANSTYHRIHAGIDHYLTSKPAKPEEYKELLDELIADGMLIEPHTKRSIRKE